MVSRTWRDDGWGSVVCRHGEVDDRLALAVDVDAGGAHVRLLPLEHPDAPRPGSVAQREPAPALRGKGLDRQVHRLGNLKELVLEERKMRSKPQITNTRIEHYMVTVGRPQWDNIKILGNFKTCPFVCMFVCVYMVGRYQKFDGVPL